MIVQIDSREKKNKHIVEFFNQHRIPWVICKMDFGDYRDEGSLKTVIERKANLLEFAGNCGKGHKRFDEELLRFDYRTKVYGTRLIVLIEEPNMHCLEDMKSWSHERSQMKGEVIYKICLEWQKKHNMEFRFCKPEDAGMQIYELLKESV